MEPFKIPHRHIYAGLFFISLLTSAVSDTPSSSTDPSIPLIESAHPEVCTVKGSVYTHRQWHGYLMSKVFINFALVTFTLTYPADQEPAKLVIYYQEQIDNLNASMTCQERVDVSPKAQKSQIFHLDVNQTSLCQVVTTAGGTLRVVCTGESFFKTSSAARRWYFVIARCGATRPLLLDYTFNVTGYLGDCDEDPLAPYKLPGEHEQITCDCAPEMNVDPGPDYTREACTGNGNSASSLLWSLEQKLWKNMLMAVFVYHAVFSIMNIRSFHYE